MSRDPRFRAAVEQWRGIRAEYELYLEAQYAAAEEACSGVLLNRRGQARGIDPYSLFYGPRVRVEAYASRELRDWFAAHGRVTFSEYEVQMGAVGARHWGELTVA